MRLLSVNWLERVVAFMVRIMGRPIIADVIFVNYNMALGIECTPFEVTTNLILKHLEYMEAKGDWTPSAISPPNAMVP